MSKFIVDLRPAAWRPFLRDAFCALLLLPGIYAAVFRDLLLGERSCATFQDNTYLFFPIFHHMWRVLRSGEFPYWINTIGGGLPLYSSPQFSSIYPFYFLNSPLFSSQSHILLGLHLLIMLHLLILLYTTYFLLRVLKASPLASALGAALFTFGANMRSYIVWVNIVAPYSWLPLAGAGLVLLLGRKHRFCGIVITIGGMSLLALASPAQPLIHAVYFALVLTCWRAAQLIWARKFEELAALALDMGVAAAGTLALSSPVIVPAALFMKEAIRFLGPSGAVIGNAPIPLAAMQEGQYSWPDLANVFLPLQAPRIIGDAYIGLPAAALALIAVFFLRKHWTILPLLGLALYALLSALGAHTLLFRLNSMLPLLSKVREPTRHLALFVLCMSILAAFGYDRLRERSTTKFGLLWLLTVGLSLSAAAYWSAGSVLTYRETVSKEALLAVGAVSFALIIVAQFSHRWIRLFSLPALGGLAIYSAIQFPAGCLRLTESDLLAKENIESRMILQHLSELPDIESFRVLFDIQRHPLSSQFWAMNAADYKIRTLSGYFNPLPAKQFSEVWDAHGMARYGMLLGVRYLLCDSCTETEGFDLVETRGPLKIFAAARSAPYFFPAYKIAGAIRSSGEFFNMVNAGFTYDQGILVSPAEEKRLGHWLSRGEAKESNEASAVNVINKTANTRSVTVSSTAPIVLVMNEYYSRDWKAWIDGEQKKLFPVNLNQIGLKISAGKHIIEYRYSPALFERLRVVQLIALVLMGAASAWRLWAGWRSAMTSKKARLNRPAQEQRG